MEAAAQRAAARPRLAAIESVVARALDDLGELADVVRVGLAVVEGGGRRLRFTASDRDLVPTEDSMLDWCLIDAYDDVPLTSVVRTGVPVMADLDKLPARYTDLVVRQREQGVAALAALPLVVGGAPLGGVVVFYDNPQDFDLVQRRQLLARTAALAEDLRAAQSHVPRAPEPVAEEPDPEVGSTVAGPQVARVGVAGEARAVALARRFVRRQLVEWEVADEVIDSAVLCVSELVTNAVIHTATPSELTATLDGDLLTIAVRDHGAESTGPHASASRDTRVDPLEVHGRGLQLVEALSSRWGSELDATGTTVWFVLQTG
ncbi:hypothetical protein BH11ACT8_BH11ACT8_25020 [soil metagenome]